MDTKETETVEVKHQMEVRPDCKHNTIVENDDPTHVWKCYDCGYVFN